MRKQGRKEELVQSKYFSIDSYFKSPPNKKIKTAFNDQIEKQLSTLEARKEKCPLCCTLICIESVSMQVHVNACLDSQQENAIPVVSWKDSFACLVDNSQEKQLLVKETKEDIIKVYETEEDGDEECEAVVEEKGKVKENYEEKQENVIAGKEIGTVVQHEDKDSNVKAATGLGRILPSSWKSIFSSSSTVVTPLLPKSTNIALNPRKSNQRMCPFYKRVRGNIL